MVPFSRNPYFVGRRDEFAALEQALESGQVAAITQVLRGLGGIGKTQTAVEYAYRKREAYSAVLWTRADDEAALTAGFVGIAKVWGLPEADPQDIAVAVRATQKALTERSGWLLVVDNADNPELLPHYLPTNPQGDILVTSRAEDFRMLGNLEPLLLKPLPEDDALSFFARSAQLTLADTAEVEAAKRLALELGYLPLALEQAAAYILRKKRTWSAPQKLYHEEL